MTILSRNDQKGRSMVEMLGVLAIIGVLSVGGISGYSKAMAKFKLTKAQDQISMLLMNIRTAFATSPSYEGLDVETAISYNIAPKDMKMDNDSLSNAFGGSTVVSECSGELVTECAAVDTNANSNQYFGIKLTRLARETCVSLATSDWGSDGLVGMYINSTEYKASDMPVSFADAGTACDSATDTDYSTITWVYY